MTDLADAWDELHAALPDGRAIMRPVHSEEHAHGRSTPAICAVSGGTTTPGWKHSARTRRSPASHHGPRAPDRALRSPQRTGRAPGDRGRSDRPTSDSGSPEREHLVSEFRDAQRRPEGSRLVPVEVDDELTDVKRVVLEDV